MKLCSACLLGINCRYDGKNRVNEKVLELAKKEKLIPVCPEQLAGLPTPRSKSEISNGKVIAENGDDVTEQFQKGAEETLRIAKENNITEAIMKQKSPSCGCGKIFDGTFSGKVIDGWGMTADLLRKNGIKVISEEEL
ncbi:MAG TPA: DUF523 domain-containing protein [Patescibacteria group bacterium]|nr:DUF523 domain-containing protein [Patescibacteria group bacterium]